MNPVVKERDRCDVVRCVAGVLADRVLRGRQPFLGQLDDVTVLCGPVTSGDDVELHHIQISTGQRDDQPLVEGIELWLLPHVGAPRFLGRTDRYGRLRFRGVAPGQAYQLKPRMGDVPIPVVNPDIAFWFESLLNSMLRSDVPDVVDGLVAQFLRWLGRHLVLDTGASSKASLTSFALDGKFSLHEARELQVQLRERVRDALFPLLKVLGVESLGSAEPERATQLLDSIVGENGLRQFHCLLRCFVVLDRWASAHAGHARVAETLARHALAPSESKVSFRLFLRNRLVEWIDRHRDWVEIDPEQDFEALVESLTRDKIADIFEAEARGAAEQWEHAML